MSDTNTALSNVVIWLEDNIDYYQEIKEFLEEELKKKQQEISLRTCDTLKEFKDITDMYRKSPEKLKGFIIDILIPADDLGPLGLKIVKTEGGNVTGVQVLEEYIRDIYGQRNDSTFKEHKVLMLTCLSEVLYKRYLDQDDQSTTWLSKADETGLVKSSYEALKKWVRDL